jgi:stearoyl-CoA desaturase (delta-9 desaturase)
MPAIINHTSTPNKLLKLQTPDEDSGRMRVSGYLVYSIIGHFASAHPLARPQKANESSIFCASRQPMLCCRTLIMTSIPWDRVNWRNSVFLMSLLFLALVGVPIYLWRYGLDWFQAALFLVFFSATGLSITLGYHRLFSHRSFRAAWPVRLATLVFGAAAFENSALCWASDHRRHHKHTDSDDDPYDISKGFWHAHIGWILFKMEPATHLDNVKDLQADPLVRWQHKYYFAIAGVCGLLLPAVLGGLWAGWPGALGGFLMGGVARIVAVQQFTFFINSLCHTIGRQPYSSRNTAKDSAIMAFFTFGEGYHNYHHAFQYDYRNGVKPWQFDPTKWSIWLLARLGLASDLRRVPAERILLAEIEEKQRRLESRLHPAIAPKVHPALPRLQATKVRLQETFARWEAREIEYRQALQNRLASSRERWALIQRDFREATAALRSAILDWQEAYTHVEKALA